MGVNYTDTPVFIWMNQSTIFFQKILDIKTGQSV